MFDYRDPEVASKIKGVTGDSLTKGVDAIGEPSSQRICAESLGPKGGKVILVSNVAEGATQRTDVVLQRESPPLPPPPLCLRKTGPGWAPLMCRPSWLIGLVFY